MSTKEKEKEMSTLVTLHDVHGLLRGGFLTRVRLQVVGELVWSAVRAVELRH